MRRNEPLRTTTIDELCNILDCEIQDVAAHIKDEKKEL